MIELIMVIVMLGILAVFAVPRMTSTSSFVARGFQDETLALLRFAQKAAIAERRSVCVNLNATGITMNIFNTNPSSGNCGGATTSTLALPNTPKGGTGLAATVNGASIAQFQFNPLGNTNQTSQVQVTIANAAGTIYVESTTGYVHE